MVQANETVVEGGRLPDDNGEPVSELPSDSQPPRDVGLIIQIDRKEYRLQRKQLQDGKLTGRQIRRLPDPDVGPDRDLYEVVPGSSDRKIEDDELVVIRNGLRFFTAPRQINPGCLRVVRGQLKSVCLNTVLSPRK